MINNINLLVFSVYNLSFGVCAEQIVEFVEDRLLSEQEEASLEYTILYEGQDIRVIHFSRQIEHEQKTHIEDLGLEPDTDFYTFSPKILIIKHQHEEYIGVRIDNIDDLVTVSIKQIHSLPVIMEKTKRIQGLWGIALVENRPVVLIDLTQL